MGDIVIGVGTGRCGSTSLSQLLCQQPGSRVTHERYAHKVRWNCPSYLWAYRLFMDLNNEQVDVAGDCAFYWTPHIEQFIHWGNEFDVQVRIIGLVRPRDEVIASYERWVTDKNHWQYHNGEKYEFSDWDKCYPIYKPGEERGVAIGRFWDHCVSLMQNAANNYSEVKLFETRELNNEVGVRYILKHAGIPQSNWKVEAGITENTSRQYA